MNIKLIYQR